METTTAHIAIPDARRWKALVILCTAQFMVIMDTSIIGVALPAIQKDLGYSPANLQWIFNAYVIFLGGLLLLGGKLSDLFGPKKVFLSGFWILTLASLLAGLAWSENVMNMARALQGAGSALIAPAALTLLMTMFTDPKELGKALGFWGAAAAAGGSAGVFFGGVLTEWLSWHWTFLINIPLGIAVIITSKNFLATGRTQKGNLNTLSAIIGTSALVLLVYGIISLESISSESLKSVSSLLLAVLLFYAFFKIQKKSKNPLLPLAIFKRPNLSAGNLVMMLLAGSWIPLWFFLNIYLQQVLHLSAFKSGLALLPMTLVIMVMMTNVTAKVIGKLGVKNTLLLGLMFLSLSLVLFSFVSETGSYSTDVLPASILAAIGMSLAYIPGTITSMSGASEDETGLASGIVNTSYQVGSALGLASIVAISSLAASYLQTGTTNEGIRIAFGCTVVISVLSVVLAALKIKK